MSRILIVEDDPDFRALLETMLRLEGHEVHLAANGETGLTQAHNRRPEIILSDVDMPGLSGTQLTQKVRSDPATAHAYIILITGRGEQETKLDGLRAGADDFVVKPSSQSEILGRLEIAQKVIGVQAQVRDAEARAAALAEVPRSVESEINSLEQYLFQAEESIGKKDARALAAAVKAAGDSVKKVRHICSSTGGAPPGDSWL